MLENIFHATDIWCEHIAREMNCGELPMHLRVGCDLPCCDTNTFSLQVIRIEIQHTSTNKYTLVNFYELVGHIVLWKSHWMNVCFVQ